MIDIKVSQNQKDALVEELSNLVIKYKKMDIVECIYITPFIEDGKSLLEVTIVASFDKYLDDILEIEKYNAINKMQENIEKFGLEICIGVDNPAKYNYFAMNPSECRRDQFLYNATILYDPKGRYAKLKNNINKTYKKNHVFYYNNLGTIIPPIVDDTIEKINIKSK